MTVVAGHVITGFTAPAPPPGGCARASRAAPAGRPPSLVRRPDGQVIQMSALLYRVTCRIDGSRDRAAIAELVSADLGRSLTAEQVR